MSEPLFDWRSISKYCAVRGSEDGWFLTAPTASKKPAQATKTLVCAKTRFPLDNDAVHARCRAHLAFFSIPFLPHIAQLQLKFVGEMERHERSSKSKRRTQMPAARSLTLIIVLLIPPSSSLPPSSIFLPPSSFLLPPSSSLHLLLHHHLPHTCFVGCVCVCGLTAARVMARNRAHSHRAARHRSCCAPADKSHCIISANSNTSRRFWSREAATFACARPQTSWQRPPFFFFFFFLCISGKQLHNTHSARGSSLNFSRNSVPSEPPLLNLKFLAGQNAGQRKG